METSTSDAKGPKRVAETHKVEPVVLGMGGGVLLLLSSVFLWQELALRSEAAMLLVAAGAVAAALGLGRARVPMAGPLVLLGATGVAGLWYGATREPMLLGALLTLFVGTLAAIVVQRFRSSVESQTERRHRLLSWQAVAISGLGASFATYFHIFDASDLNLQHFVARRAVLTFFWLLSGVVMVLLGRGKQAPEIRDAGFLVLAASMGKLLIYDTTHLDGFLRIGALGIAGLVLLASAHIARALTPARS